MSTKALKFPPSTFLEIDTLLGGRRVVMVGRDGVTYWDSLDHINANPVSVHAVLRPEALGSTVEFVQNHGLKAVHARLREHLRSKLDKRVDDALFVMRTLWCLNTVKAGGNWVPGDDELVQALEAAKQQELSALRLQQQAAKFCEMEAA